MRLFIYKLHIWLGLIVAIPALVAFAFFQNKTDRLVTDVTEATTEVYHDLVFLVEPPSEAERKKLKADSKAADANQASLSH